MSALLATQASLPLHSLPTWVDVMAMAVGAAFGAATGRNRRLPLLAVLTAGVISGLAGGMIRDVLLGLEAAAIKNWYYIPALAADHIRGLLGLHRRRSADGGVLGHTQCETRLEQPNVPRRS